jgi:hypothetical protein
MTRTKLKDIFSKLPALGTLILGFGALLAGNARADTLAVQPIRSTLEPSGQSATRSDVVQVRIEGETIYISQYGDIFEELRLGDVPETAHLKELLRDAGAERQSISVPVGAMIVASGGGSGKGGKPKDQTPSTTTEPSTTSEQGRTK